MAGLRCASVVLLALLIAAFVRTQESQGSTCPPGNPFCPIWVECNYTEIQGPYCHNCTVRAICTAVGGLLRTCNFPGNTHCVNGQCTSQPSEECAPQVSSTPGSTNAQTGA